MFSTWPLFKSSIDSQGRSPDSGMDAHVDRICERAMHELLLASLLFGFLVALGVTGVLRDSVPRWLLGTWLTARVLASVIRGLHSRIALRRPDAPLGQTVLIYRILAALDGVAWGMLGWALTPIMRLDIAVVTICVLIGVAALGTFMLHVDLPSAAVFILPILLPNAIYSMSRHDELGMFCATTVLGLLVVLLLEARRSNRRIRELLRLRFQSEQVARTQAEALLQAEALSETRSRFLATMSHEMRTPLHGILGLVRLLRQRGLDEVSNHQLDLIRGSGDHLVNVIGDILDFSQMEAGTLPLHDQVFNLKALIREVTDASSVMAAEKGLTLEVQLDIEQDEEVLGDPVRLRQILHNLLGNGIKFTREGFVRLLVRREAFSNAVLVEVQDSGIGIPEAEQSGIFEAFCQAEGTYQRRFGGSGLGLTISRELCRAMGGNLTCRSQVGQGSVFTFTLPLPPKRWSVSALLPSEAGEPHEDMVEPTPGCKPHVLLVEDNPVNALVAEAELQRLGVTVTVINNGKEAVDWLESHQADLVLMDCEMPEMDGFEATRLIRDREQLRGGQPISIVALTANGRDVQGDRYGSVGMNGYLAKPFESNDLVSILTRHVRRSRRPALELELPSLTSP